MHLEPESGAADADLREVRPLATISNERGALFVDLVDAFNGTPHEYVGGAGTDILRVAVDAALGDVDEAAAFNG